MTKRSVVFFDRDGVINTAPSPEEYYVLTPDRFFLEPGFVDALRVVQERGWAAVVVTNQFAIGRGLLSEEGLLAIHSALREELLGLGLQLTDILHCPHGGDHSWRKPNPGMLFHAAEAHELDLASAWMIGDSPRDIQAGNRAGCATTVFIGDPVSPDATHSISSVNELSALLRDRLSNTNLGSST